MDWKLAPGRHVDLNDYDPADSRQYRDKPEVSKEMEDMCKKLEDLQETLYAQKEHAVLFVLQGMDCSGKDGVIKGAFSPFHPQGFQAHSFKKPTEEEEAHDFLWRAHKLVPAKGHIAAFNRSYYEEVLINRVHGHVSDKVAKRRFKQINRFEETLIDGGVTVVKLFLHISKEFQRAKLISRIRNPEKNWKFDKNDLLERKMWDEYKRSYEDVFENCSDKSAPWYLIPSDRRWYRDFAAMRIAVETLENLPLHYPAPDPELPGLLKELERE